jgi:YVTN family beta-propeller protein
VALAGSSNSLLDISTDGRWLATANRDNGTVSLVDLSTGDVVHQVPVGKKPEGVTFLGPTHHVAATVYADDKVVLIDAPSGQKLGEVDVFDEPYGIVSNAAGTRLYVTLDYPGQVLEIDVDSRKVIQTWPVGKFTRGIAVDPRQPRLLVTEYYTGDVSAVELTTGKVVDRWRGATSDNLARQITVHPQMSRAYVPHIRSRVHLHQGEGSVVPDLSILDTAPGTSRRRKVIPLDAFYGTFVVANPWEAAISPDGRQMGIVFAGSDDMYVCHILDDNYRELEFRKVLNVGHNPRAIRYAPDGKRFYVYNTLDFNVAVFDAETLRPVSTITVCSNPLGNRILQGKILFYSALQPMVGRRWISCSSCHPDGDSDGRTWQNPEGLRNTTALFGMAWTHPIHWSADRDEVQDFEHTIRSPLMQGRGLIRGDVQPALGQPNKGRSKALDALAAYSNSHRFTLSPHARPRLSESALRGKELFFSAKIGCAKCHSGPLYTDSTPQSPFKRHDVGTGDADPSEKLGSKYDTPTLLGVYRTAPYLHHGQAQSLEEVLTKFNPADRHGKTSQLSQAQVADLVEFLKALPYEDPEEAAEAAGLTKVE